MNKATENRLGFFPADARASVVPQPSDSALDRPAPLVALQGSSILSGRTIGAVGSNQPHALTGELLVLESAFAGVSFRARLCCASALPDNALRALETLHLMQGD